MYVYICRFHDVKIENNETLKHKVIGALASPKRHRL
jgi:hypothetical protein